MAIRDDNPFDDPCNQRVVTKNLYMPGSGNDNMRHANISVHVLPGLVAQEVIQGCIAAVKPGPVVMRLQQLNDRHVYQLPAASLAASSL